MSVAVGERGPHGLLEPRDRQPNIEPENVLTARLLLAQPPHVFRTLVPYQHTQIRVDDHDRRSQTRENALEECIHLVELLAANPDLVVRGVKLLVRRL